MTVWHVNTWGTVFLDVAPDMRLSAEAARIEAIKASGAVPAECGPEYVNAPARGCFRVVDFHALYPKGTDEWESKPAGFEGRRTVERQDVFGEMLAQAARARRPAPLSPGQIAMGRFFRDLHERHACAGLRCSSVEAMPGGSGGTAAGFMDAVLADRARLDVLRDRLSDAPAPKLRAVRPSKRGSRVSITTRALVEAVCLRQMHLDAVLRAHGWSVYGETRTAARKALALGLEALMGP